MVWVLVLRMLSVLLVWLIIDCWIGLGWVFFLCLFWLVGDGLELDFVFVYLVYGYRFWLCLDWNGLVGFEWFVDLCCFLVDVW